MLEFVLLANVAATLYLCGVIWCVQLVHYPLMEWAASDRFAGFHEQHSRLMSWVVLLPMVVDLGTSAWLAYLPPRGIAPTLLYGGFALAVLTWAVTFFVSVPLHGRLARGFEPAAHRALVRTNWWRTVFWTLHATLTLEILRRLLLAMQ